MEPGEERLKPPSSPRFLPAIRSREAKYNPIPASPRSRFEEPEQMHQAHQMHQTHQTHQMHPKSKSKYRQTSTSHPPANDKSRAVFFADAFSEPLVTVMDANFKLNQLRLQLKMLDEKERQERKQNQAQKPKASSASRLPVILEPMSRVIRNMSSDLEGQAMSPRPGLAGDRSTWWKGNIVISKDADICGYL